jgi:hypothetical protein
MHCADSVGGIKNTIALLWMALRDRRVPLTFRIRVAASMARDAFACGFFGHAPALRTWRRSPRALLECARCCLPIAIMPRVI